jgi:hypothetical protein
MTNMRQTPASRPLSRRPRAAALAMAMLLGALATGCSLVQALYNRVDWLVGHELARYVELDAAQQRLFHSGIGELWSWHRRVELPAYARDLRELAQASAQPLDQAQAEGYAQRYVDVWFRVLRHGQPATCALLATLSDSQVQDVMDEAQKDLDRYQRSYIRPGEARVREDSERKQLKTLQRWLGPVDPAQRELLHRWAFERPFLPPAWLDYRRAWRQQLGEVLAARRDPQFCERFGTLMLDPAARMPETLRRQSQDNQRAWATLLSQLSATLTDPQRAHLRDQLLALAGDFDRLGAQ